MTTQPTESRTPDPQVFAPPVDPAQQSLAEALRVSFSILKFAMFALLIAYAFSGTFSVGSNEVALRLRFGDYVGDPGKRVLEEGTYLAAPFPIEEIVKVDTRPTTLVLDKEFWFETRPEQSGLTRTQMMAQLAQPLDPLKDGSLITGDSSIAHAKWSITWRIADPVAFLTNVGNQNMAAELVRIVAQQGIVRAVAGMPAEALLRSVFDRALAVGVMQERLDDMRTGIVIDQLALEKPSVPMQVASSFDDVTTAETSRSGQIVAAQQERDRILGETAGQASDALLKLIVAYEQASEEGNEAAAAEAEMKIEKGLADLAIDGTPISGDVARVINTATTYRTQIVEKVSGEAQTFNELLPQYEKNPRLVLSRIWEDARETILTGKDVETFYTVPGRLELQLNRDPNLQKQRQQDQLKAMKKEQKRLEQSR